MFGAEDKFLNMFARLAQLSPVLPLIGGGYTRFQPVYVGDIAEAVLAIVRKPEAQGKIYQLGGSKVYSFKEIVKFILKTINRHNLLLPIPYFFAKIKGAILQLLPMPLLTVDQVRLLQYDNVLDHNALGFKQLGIVPREMEQIAPPYLIRYHY